MTNDTTNQPWEILQTYSVFDHPFIKVDVEKVRLPDGQIIPDWPKIYTSDYVNAVVFNEDNEAMVIEGYKHGTGWSSWQLLGNHLQEGDDPVSAIQQALVSQIGCKTNHWIYLGSYVIDPNQHVGVGHFFCALGAKKIETAHENNNDNVKWVPLNELRFALLDGRIASLSYAITVSLALLTVMNETAVSH